MHDHHVLRSTDGIEAHCSAYGARLLALKMPDRHGQVADVLLGTDDPAAAHARSSYFGATCGRYANRIRDGHLRLDGATHQLARNEGPHHLHGGTVGFDQRTWQASAIDDGVQYALRSEAGDQGYPGALTAQVRFRLTGRVLRIEFAATADAATVVNLANHAYWNLSGVPGADMLDHEVAIRAQRYLPVDEALIPTGELAGVQGTAFDLRTAQPMGQILQARAQGFDHCFVLDGQGWRQAVRVLHAPSGRGFELHTDQPAMQFYTCMHFGDGFAGKGGATYRRFGGLVFESQNYPDAPNHAHFPSAILRPGEHYRHAMEYRFFGL